MVSLEFCTLASWQTSVSGHFRRETEAETGENNTQAHVKYGFPFKDSADHIRIHYLPVSKAVSMSEK